MTPRQWVQLFLILTIIHIIVIAGVSVVLSLTWSEVRNIISTAAPGHDYSSTILILLIFTIIFVHGSCYIQMLTWLPWNDQNNDDIWWGWLINVFMSIVMGSVTCFSTIQYDIFRTASGIVLLMYTIPPLLVGASMVVMILFLISKKICRAVLKVCKFAVVGEVSPDVGLDANEPSVSKSSEASTQIEGVPNEVSEPGAPITVAVMS